MPTRRWLTRDDDVRAADRVPYRLLEEDRSYRYGIGLEIVTDFPIVDRTVIEGAIRRFRELGETDWQYSEPIPRGHLPFQTEAEAMAAAALHMPQG